MSVSNTPSMNERRINLPRDECYVLYYFYGIISRLSGCSPPGSAPATGSGRDEGRQAGGQASGWRRGRVGHGGHEPDNHGVPVRRRNPRQPARGTGLRPPGWRRCQTGAETKGGGRGGPRPSQWKFHDLFRGWGPVSSPPCCLNPANFRAKVARPCV